MRYLFAFSRSCKVKYTIFLLIQFISISFFTHAYAFRDVSIPVWTHESTDEIKIVLHKEQLSDFMEIASDDEVLRSLANNEKAMKECKVRLTEAQKENKGKEALSNLRKRLEEAEKTFRSTLSKYGKETIEIVLRAGYRGPIYLCEKKDDAEYKRPPLFSFQAEGGITENIHICKLEDLSKDIKAKLIVKGVDIEVIKEDAEYRLIFDKAKDVVIKSKGELRGKADFAFRISPQVDNPISFLKTQSPADKPIKIKIPVDKIDKGDHLHVYFLKDSTHFFPSALPVGEKEKPQDAFYIFKAYVPDSFKGDGNVAAMIINNDGEIKGYNTSKFRVRNENRAVFYGVISVCAAIFVLSLLCKGGWRTWWRAPLDFTVSPLHRYSVSLLQILIWTAITMFSYIYVYYLQGEFLLLTNQILILLGISGATALSAKATAVVKLRDIPDKYYKKENGKDDLRDRKRKPELSDYVSIGGIPNLFKFQILGFTVITGIIVVWELIKTSNFPEIPDGLLTLMGISGGAYVGNELSTENLWTKLQQKVELAEKKLKEWRQEKPKIEPDIERIKNSIKHKKTDLQDLSKMAGKEVETENLRKSIAEEEEKLANLKILETEYQELKGEIYKKLEKIFS